MDLISDKDLDNTFWDWRATEKQFRALIEHSSEVIALLNGEGVIRYTSPAIERILGYSSDELHGRNAFELLHPDDFEINSRLFSQLLAQPDLPAHSRFRFLHKDGTWRWIEATGTNLLNDENIRAIVVNFRDISEQIVANQTLQIRIAFDQSLLRLSRKFELAQGYHEVIQAAHETVQANLGYQNVWLYLAKSNDELILLTSVGTIAEIATTEYPTLKITGDKFLEEMWRSKDAVVVVDAQTDPRTDKEIVARLGNRTIINVPMMLQNQLLGFLGTGTFGDEGIRPPSEEQLEYFSAVASHIAVAISRIQLLEELEQRVRFTVLLNSMARIALEATDLPSMLQRMVDRLAELFRADACYLTFWDEVRKVPIPMAAFGPLQDSYQQIQIESGELTLTDSVLQAEHALVIENVRTSPYMGPGVAAQFPNPTAVGLPLIAGQQKLGAVILGYNQRRAFPVTEVIQAEQATAQIALAIAKTQLLDSERRRREEAETLREAASFLAASFDLEQILETLLAYLKRIVPYDSACVFLREGEVIHAVAASGHPNPEQIIGKRFPLQNDQLQPEIYRTGLPLILEDAQTDPRFLGWGETNYIRGWMGIPLWARGQLIGVLTIDSREPGAYTLADAALAQAFANQAAIAIDNARLLEAERRRRTEAETLRETASSLTASLDLDQVLKNLLTSLQRVVPCDSACVFLREGDYVRAMAATGHPAPEQIINKRYPLADNLLQPEIYRTGQPLILEDAQATTRFLKWGNTDYVRGWMGIPLWARGNIIGVLTVDSRQPGAYTMVEARLAQSFANQAAVAIENARLFAETLQHQSELATLLSVSQSVSSSLDLQQVLQQVALSMTQLLHLEWSALSIYDPLTDSLHTEVEYSSTDGYTKSEIGKQYPLTHFPATAHVLQQNKPLVIRINDPEAEPAEKALLQEIEVACALLLPIVVAGRMVGLAELYTEDETREFSQEEIRLAQALADQAAIAISNAQLFSETRQRLSELEAVNRISKALRTAQKMDDMFPPLLDETSAILGTEAGIIWLYDPYDQKLHPKVASGWFTELKENTRLPGEGIAGRVFQTGEIYRSQAFLTDPNTHDIVRPKIPAEWGGVCVPLRAGQEVIGVFFISVQSPRQLTDQEVHLLTTVAEIAGSAIHRAQLNTMIQNQLQRLLALRAIDSAISASLDIRLTLNLLLEHVLSELNVDAACVLLAAPYTYTLQFAAGRGFHTTAFQQVLLHFGDGLAGRVAAEQTPITVNDLSALDLYTTSKMVQQEGFIFYTGVPLIAKGQVKGVLEVFQRAPFFAPADWLDFLDALAAQAAIAIDSAQLFEDLQRSNSEITFAYDNTLEGWVRMLDLRDKETEGHTQRVTEMTLDLARAVGIPDEDLIHIRRGALLHDIGKMAVPDRILLKPDSLTEEEWLIMRQHPKHAFDMLAPIPFLRAALDIPYCHHERWDGTGYPRKLSGKQIPHAARIFSIVDVWDALTNDRPYRKAWSPEQARAYLVEQSGKYFDPEILEVFLHLLDEP